VNGYGISIPPRYLHGGHAWEEAQKDAQLRIPRNRDWEHVRGLNVSRFPLPMVVESRQFDIMFPEPDGFILRIHMLVLDRDTGEPKQIIFFHNVHPLEVRSQGEVWSLHRALTIAVNHELNECFIVGGKRIFDPHEGDVR
jgi:hypothetical protein